jgi:hypothetical protein
LFDVEFRPHIGIRSTALGKVEVEHPITQCWAEGQLLAYYFHESGHLSVIHSRLIPEQVAHLKDVVATEFGVIQTMSQAKPLAEAPSAEEARPSDSSDLEEAGL